MENKILRYILIAGLSYAASLGMGYLSGLQDEAVFNGVGDFGFGPASVLFCILNAILLSRFLGRKDKRLHIISVIAGLLLAFAAVIATLLLMTNELFDSASGVFIWVGDSMALSVFTICFSEEIFLLLIKMGENFAKEGNKPLSMKFWAIWLILFLSYVPIFLARWPGNLFFDGSYQLLETVVGVYSTHHTLAHTLLMGKAYQLGMKLHNVSLGYSFYTLFQMLFMSGCFAYAVRYTIMRKIPGWFSILTFLWFALFPMHSILAISSTKDVIFSGAFLVFVIQLFLIFREEEEIRWHHYLILILNGILIVLFRNNGPYAILVGGILMLTMMKGWKKRLNFLIAAAVIILCGMGINKGLVWYTNAGGSAKYTETLSVPLQCMGRVAALHREEMEPELYEEMLNYISEEDIPNYSPYNADFLKNSSFEERYAEDLWGFISLWARIGMKFPDEYIEAVLSNTMGYWDPWKQSAWMEERIALTHKLIGAGEEIVKKDLCPPANKIYWYLFGEMNYSKIPILGYFMRSDFYIWTLAFYLLWLAYRKDRAGLLCMMIPVCYLGTCFLGPVASLRYVYSLVVILPVLLADAGKKRKQK